VESLADWAERCLLPRGKPKVIGVFEAYVDESGTEEDYLAVAGFIGLTTMWRSFESEWAKALEIAGVGYFRAKEFFGREDPFSGLSERKRATLLSALLALITDRENGLHPVAAVVDVRAFVARTEAERIYLTGGRLDRRTDKWVFSGAPSRPYYVPLCNILDRCNRSPVRVDIFHDRHTVYAKHALRLHAEMRKHREPAFIRAGLGDLVFASRFERLPLQAADLIAYLTFCRVARGRQRDDDEIGRASRALARYGDGVITFYDERTMESKLARTLPRSIREGRSITQIKAAKRREEARQRQRDAQKNPKPKPKRPR
jgi:hypothetical protein